MRIIMTQEHIDRGVPRACGACPVALAIMDAQPLVVDVHVLSKSVHVWFMHKSKFVRYETPAHVAEFIDAFDNGLRVQPIEFDLPI